ncbi:MAG TPA: murein biosynthesis integral membrane protein MurJ [Chthoniobacteraceae bacterium]|nr:murein biosynthesis integral membrane protein MurJ [Chthoniobacteraceae bacterium]
MSPKPPSPSPTPPPPGEKPARVNAKSAGVVGLAVGCSRILGLVREVVFAKLFGAGPAMDAFMMAFRIPNLLRDLFAEGALSTAFITTFSKKIEKEGDASAWQLANKMATLTVIFMSLLTLLGIVFAPWLVWLIAGGFSPEKAQLTITLTRIMFPFILLISLAALTMGMLNAKNVFGMPALASSFFNLGSIISGVGLGYWLDPTFGERALVGLAIGTLIGGLLQLVVQFPKLAQVGFRFRPDFLWRDEGVRKILLLMGPAVVAASAVQVNVMVNSRFASFIPGDGPVSWLGYSFRLMMLPLGLFGVAVATVTLPLVSRFAALHDLVGVRSALGRGLRLAFLLTVPAALGLILLAEPIISLIYQGRRFSFEDTLQTAASLRYYSLGLVAYAGIKVIAPAFYALDQRNLPMFVSFFSIATNYLLNQFFTFYLGFGHRGLALSTSLVAMINFAILYRLMLRREGGLDTRGIMGGLLKLLLGSVPMVLVCLAAQQWWFTGLETMSFWVKLVSVFGTIAVAAGAFGVAVLWLRIEEVEELRAMVLRRLGRKAAPPGE